MNQDDNIYLQAYSNRVPRHIPEAQMTPETRAKIINNGDVAKRVFESADVSYAWIQFRLDILGRISRITGHDEVANNERIALANQISALDDFGAFLRSAVKDGENARSKTQVPAGENQTDKRVKYSAPTQSIN